MFNGNMQLIIFIMTFLTSTIFMFKSSLMNMLISLELLMFLLLCLITYFMSFLFNTLTLLALLMCFAASGAAVGLTLLISMSRLYGNDMIMNLL